LIPADKAKYMQARQDAIDFAIAGGPSKIIVPTDKVNVSQSFITFNFENRSGEDYTFGEHWELAQYVDGHWQPVPYGTNGRILNTFILLKIESGGITQETINFNTRFGALTPGRYMFIRSHSPDNRSTPDTPRNQEYLLIEFNVAGISRLSQRRQNFINSAIGNASAIIVPTGDMSVSQTAVTFSFQNRSSRAHQYDLGWELAKYVDGRWQPVPYHSEIEAQGGPAIVALPLRIEGHSTKEHTITFHLFAPSSLLPGRYMFIRRHNSQYLLIEFTIDEDTPYSLDD